MELFFNLLWLLIAFVGQALWFVDRAYQKRRPLKKFLPSCMALLSAHVMVFFAISISDDIQALNDDLHRSAAVFDNCAIERRDLLSWECSHQSHVDAASAHTPAAVSSQAPFPEKLQFAEWTVLATTDVVLHLKNTPSFGRSPPL
jgi:hypothetical protein